MNYLRDNRLAAGRKKKRMNNILLAAVFILIIIFFRAPIFGFFSVAFKSLGLSFWKSSNTVKEDLSIAFQSKQSLIEENQRLNDELMKGIAEAADRKVLLDENLRLKSILDRKGGKSLTLAAILAKPNQSPYDTLIVDVGADTNISAGHRVFAYGNIPLGVVAEVYAETSLVKLYSTPGETTDIVLGVKNAYVQAIGRGGQNFEVTVPKDMEVAEGSYAVLAGITPYILAIVEKSISDPRDSFQKFILRSPINVQELKFVEIEK